MSNVMALAEIDIAAAAPQVWSALTDPEKIEIYFFGTHVTTDWQPGSPIHWAGSYEGADYEDKGQIVEVRPNRLLKLTHFSPLSGQPDVPENYHTLTFELVERAANTHVSLAQDNNASDEEAAHAMANWDIVLGGLKKVAEGT
jgi:uncharacterized protein YndB with AHSA1/START domain